MVFHTSARINTLLLLLYACLIAACTRTVPQSKTGFANSPQLTVTQIPSPTPSPQVLSSQISGLVSILEDEIRDLPDGKIAWITYWKLCWNAYPNAQGYELETMTGEGLSRKLRRQTETCFRLEVAKGQNEKALGLFNRELMLASISGQIAFRARAVLSGNRVTKWSSLMEAGKTDCKHATVLH